MVCLLEPTEQSLEHQHDLIINFIDFKKAFDSVHRPSLWKILTYYGIPDRFINIFKALYDNSSCCVKTASAYTEFFEIVLGVRQGCILSPFFFILVTDFVMHRTMDKSEYGIVWQKQNRLTDLDYANDSDSGGEKERMPRDDYQARGTKCTSWTEYKPGKKRRPWESPSAHHHNQ